MDYEINVIKVYDYDFDALFFYYREYNFFY